jgi:hypothetical protein
MRQMSGTGSFFLRLEPGHQYLHVAGLVIHDLPTARPGSAQLPVVTGCPTRRLAPDACDTSPRGELSFAWQKRNDHSGCHAAGPLATLRTGVSR